MYRNKHASSTLNKLSILSLIAICILTLQGCDKAPVEEKKEVIRPVRAMEIADVTQFGERQFPGIAKATQQVDLAFRVPGQLSEFPVIVGDTVAKGDIVARLDPRDYQVKVDNAMGQLGRARANLKRAEADYEREATILAEDAGATSLAAVERKEASRDQARADVKAVKATVAAANDDLKYTYLRAPYKGIVVDTYLENFESVRAKESIVRILDNSSIEMVINIPESMISLVPEVINIEVVFDPFPTVIIPAMIKEIGTEASKSTRTYPVNLIMSQPDDVKILPGMAGMVTGESPGADESLIATGKQVPLSAIFSPDDIEKTYVWVIDKASEKVAMREVKTGSLKDSGIMIIEGVKVGDWIATAGVHYLREGMKVRILDDSAE